jgi:pimeloyl-ACP methyl ester carboxylesterase
VTTTTARNAVGPRPSVLTLLEGRALLELGSLALAAPALRALGRAHAGDGHDVLVLPGFTAGDRSTAPLRAHIRAWRYRAHAWRLGRNLGPTPELIEALVDRFRALRERAESRVTIVGWSLGGIYARELARSYPDDVRAVITLGSPFRMRFGVAGMPPEQDRPRLAVPSTAIYTRTDGVARWHTCIDVVGATTENIEVRGSHSGLGFNPAVLYAIADRLALSEGAWKQFRPPVALRSLYPRPATWEPR